MGESCKRHPQNAVIAKCIACGEDICRECRDEFGYFCSQECLQKTKGSVDPVQKAKTKKSVEAGMRMERILSWSAKIIGLLILIGIGYFVYSTFFSPYGKLAWSWNGDMSAPGQGIAVIAPGKKALLLNGSASLIFDGEKLKTANTLGYNDLQKLESCVGLVGSSALLQGENSLGLLSADGALLWSKEFKDLSILQLAAGDEQVIALLGPSYRALAKDLESGSIDSKKAAKMPQPFLLCLKAGDGSELWRKTLQKNESISGLSASKGLFACSGYALDKTGEPAGFLRVGELAKGDTVWQAKLKDESGIEPFFAGDAVIFESGGSLNAISLDGASKLWSFKLGDSYLSKEEMAVSGDSLVLLGGKGLACINLKEHKTAWEIALPFTASELKVDAGKVLLLGYPSEGPEPQTESAKPPTVDILKDGDLSSAAILNKAAASVKRSKPAVLAFDLATGNELWRKEGVYGELVCGDGRIALISDTAKTQLASMIGGTLKGDMVVTQLSASSGKALYTSSNPVGMEPPYAICGNALVGMVYDRGSSVSVLGMGKAPPIQKLGFAAFKLK